MKAAVVIFVVAVITGCSAHVLPMTDTIQSQWEKSVEEFWKYISDLTGKSDDYLTTFKTSQFSTELDRIITDTFTQLSQITQSGESTVGQVSEELQLLSTKLHKDMVDAKDRSTVYLNELKTLMKQDSDDVRTRMTTYSNKLKKRLNKDAQEIRNSLSIYMDEVNARASPHVDTAKQHVHQAGDTTTEKLEELTAMVQSEVKNLGQQLETDAKELKTKLEASAQELLDTFDTMAKQVASQFREQIDNIMEKVNA
ncbi:apolipoprotein Eb [Thalassophryne amazonica]|uniref:apolipoprotein Eb n=1 Tax=Thalassophryne amazonica TaxID=390379 RepID=UPI0014721078|nr:apolipoprotein Eb [Thalassophryne amazonica]